MIPYRSKLACFLLSVISTFVWYLQTMLATTHLRTRTHPYIILLGSTQIGSSLARKYLTGGGSDLRHGIDYGRKSLQFRPRSMGDEERKSRNVSNRFTRRRSSTRSCGRCWRRTWASCSGKSLTRGAKMIGWSSKEYSSSSEISCRWKPSIT